jgi:hypothetical protein
MRRWMLGLAISMLAGSAFASPTCTNEPKDKWLSEGEMNATIAKLGFTYKAFKVTTGNCYEIYGRDNAGQRIEVYFHPVTGAIIERHKN